MKTYTFYSDESGVLDTKNTFFIFSILVIKSKNQSKIIKSKFKKLEKQLKKELNINDKDELKGYRILNDKKKQIINLLDDIDKICILISIDKISEKIKNDKKSRRRYLDFIYKFACKKYLEREISSGRLSKNDTVNLHFFIDNQNKSTNGIYDLKESISNELFYGTFKLEYDWYIQPLFTKKGNVNIIYCDSKQYEFIRLADILANYYFRYFKSKNINNIPKIKNLFFFSHP
ncbi:hypothetical protein BCF59_0371 [Mycoplasmopsis mustelae]|uniref:DUF3800 domain-containing protein n=1 Tax=Mycoplasmopsis mustelae TaxID=171289 RepID=A0A4R7UEA6_9BACT|nr:DUF3800 domain-containing protein [Mycoplasmopsis mustelae]TDV24406.1 hypothetical protein BCF59_0371 [Mycoplasmopsis mustelae]